jgi:outer membrane protein TolC
MKPLLLSFLLAGALAAPLSAEPWTAARAVEVALRQHPDAAAARARIEAAEAMVAQAEAAGRPRVSLSGRYTQTDSPMPAFGAILSQRAFTPGLDFNQPGRIDNLSVAGTVGYNLYSGGRTTAARQAARAGGRAAAEEARAVRNQLATRAIQTLLDLRKAREAVGAVEAGERAYAAAAANARLRFEAGQLLKADLLSLEVKLAETREQLTLARHGAALAAQAFLFILGESPQAGATVELPGADPTLDALVPPAESAPADRPELAGLRARLEAAERRVETARGGRRPTVDAFASYQHDRGWKLDRRGDGWLAGVSFDVAVFDGGETAARVRLAEAELAQVRAALRQAELGLALETERARLGHAAARERLAVSARTVDQAEESAALSRARFEQGALLAADLIGAESRLVEARLRRSVAEADERLALAELHRALGFAPLAAP